MHLPNAAVAVEQKQTWQVLSGVRRAPRRAAPRAWTMGLAALILGVLVLYVHTVGQEATLNHTQKEIKQLKETNTQLRSQLAGLENPGRVENVAVQKLAMEAPREVVYMPAANKVAAPRVNRIPPPPAVIHEGF
jgi:cell division protein FtsB